jgi:hypothetical protein
MASRLSSALRPARPYLIMALIMIVLGAGGMLLGEALEINYLSTLMALGGAALILFGALVLLIGLGVGIVGWVRGRTR